MHAVVIIREPEGRQRYIVAIKGPFAQEATARRWREQWITTHTRAEDTAELHPLEAVGIV